MVRKVELPTSASHGTLRAYTDYCLCEPCRAAFSSHWREQRTRETAKGAARSLKAATIARSVWDTNDPCREANAGYRASLDAEQQRAYMSEYRARKRDERPTGQIRGHR